MKTLLKIEEVLSKSFSYTFKNFTKNIKEGFFTVLLLTIIFNFLYFLINKNLATPVTYVIIFFIMGLIVSTIAFKVHREILLKEFIKNPLIKIFDYINLKYFFFSSLISLVAISPLILIFTLFQNNINFIYGINIKYLITLLVFSLYFAFRLLFVLPCASINLPINFSRINSSPFKLFLIFATITLMYVLPTYVIFVLQFNFLENSENLFKIFKPFFDFISFYISYFNYLTVFSALSYSFKSSYL